MASTWGERLKAARQKAGLKQVQLANRFRVSQKQVSVWEHDASRQVPQTVQNWIVQIESQARAQEQVIESVSEDFSYTRAIFTRLWEDSSKHARHISVEATITPCKDKDEYAYMFADVEMVITFEGLHVPPNDVLYLDCVGVPPYKDPLEDEKRRGSRLIWMHHEAQRAVITENKTVRERIGRYAIGYQIANADEYDRLTVRFKAERGVLTQEIDTIGFPVYPDCVLEFLTVRTKFVGLRPEPATAGVWLLRRTLVESRPLGLTGGPQVKVVSETESEFTIPRLKYPKAGYGYCVAWGRLTKKEGLS